MTLSDKQNRLYSMRAGEGEGEGEGEVENIVV
jgi:hypothetical protein